MQPDYRGQFPRGGAGAGRLPKLIPEAGSQGARLRLKPLPAAAGSADHNPSGTAGGVNLTYLDSSNSRTLFASAVMANGFVSTDMPGSRWFETAAFSAYPVMNSICNFGCRTRARSAI